MPKSCLYETRSEGRYQIASAESAQQLGEDLSQLYISERSFSEVLKDCDAAYGDWLIESSGGPQAASLTISEYVEGLTSEDLPSDFRADLTRISASAVEYETQRDALPYFDQSRFCEFRAAFAALTLPEVDDVSLIPANSREDRYKQDIVVHTEHEAFPLQVKANEGKKGRVGGGVPTLRNVLIRSFSALALQLQHLIR